MREVAQRRAPSEVQTRPRVQEYTLNADDAYAIMRATPSTQTVRLVALDANWGPPVSGRTDTDFVQVWAAVAASSRPRRVSLSGARVNGEWDIEVELWYVPFADVIDEILYFAALGPSQSEFPCQFVIRLEGEDGSVSCDSNGGYGVNYRLAPYQGRMTSAVRGVWDRGEGVHGGAIWLLPKITPFVLIAPWQVA